MAKKDYYAILEIERTATEVEIKASYRKLAMQHHPDRNPGNDESEAKFKEINEAYSILSDASKRGQYDRFGTAGDSPFGGFSGDVDLSDIFEGFFSGGFGSRSRRTTTRKGEDLEYLLKIDLKTSIYGGKHTISFPRYDECSVCDGVGGSGRKDCQKCKGEGHVKYRQESFFGVIESSRLCDECDGTGEVFSNTCEECEGKKRVRIEKKIEIDIPAGIDDGMIIKLTSEGNAGVGTKARGDLYIKFDVTLEEKGLKRDDIDLFYKLEVDLLEAVLGNEKDVNIPILGKRKIKIASGTQYGAVLKFAGDGVKEIQKDKKGDLYIEVVFTTPKKLSKKEKELYKNLASEKKVEHSGDEGILGKIFG